jgi:hypothetical protein
VPGLKKKNPLHAVVTSIFNDRSYGAWRIPQCRPGISIAPNPLMSGDIFPMIRRMMEEIEAKEEKKDKKGKSFAFLLLLSFYFPWLSSLRDAPRHQSDLRDL